MGIRRFKKLVKVALSCAEGGTTPRAFVESRRVDIGTCFLAYLHSPLSNVSVKATKNTTPPCLPHAFPW